MIDGDATVLECASRSQTTTTSRPSKLSSAVAESFFDELLRIATSISSGTDDEKYTCSLAELVRSINLFEVRNAVAHPNREFPENYWYRCAVVATSLPVTMLALTQVSQAFQAALDNKITLPPEEWLDLSSSIIPNNLPREIEHDSTGLIGRQKERKQLLTMIKSRRAPVIVITGPGGLGKTALATQVLREYSQDFTNIPEHEAIVFTSLKQEQLTSDGVNKLDAVESIEELRIDLYEEISNLFPEVEAQDFESICGQLSERKILLFIDNLETLLRDAPDSFGALCDNLPREWSVLATSRVTLDGGRSIPLEILSIPDSTSLGFRYANTRQVDITEDAIRRIVTASRQNPLALRLGIDFVAQVCSIDEATKRASADVVGFSFQNLVSALPTEGLSILEGLFVKSPMGRGEMIALLNLSSEKVVENARRLARTSLVRREVRGEDEEFDLNPSVRDLLRDSPADLDARVKIQKALQEQRKNLNRHLQIIRNRNTNEYSEEFLPENISPALGNTLARCIRYVKSGQHSYKQTNALAKELNEFSFTNAAEWRIWLWLGKLYSLLQDDKTAEIHYRRAIEKDNGSPVPLIAMCEFLCKSQNFKEALQLAEGLIDSGYGLETKGDEVIASRIWFSYLRCLSENGKFEDIINLNFSSISNERIRSVLRIFKAEALIRSASPSHSDSSVDVGDNFIQVIKLIKDGIKFEHYQKSIVRLILFFLREAKHFIDQASEDDPTGNRLLPLLKQLPNFIRTLLDSDVLEAAAHDEVISFISWARNHSNPEVNASFSSATWNADLGLDSDIEAKIHQATENGFEIASIIRIPNKGVRDGFSDYCFARLASGIQVFIHKDNVERMEFLRWIRLRVGNQIGVADLMESRRDKLPIASRVVLI